MVRKILLILLILPLIIIIFMPKQELYYLLEERLKEQNIVISGETLDETLLGLKLRDPEIYISGILVATAEEIDLWSLFLYTKVMIKNLHVADGLPGSFAIDRIDAVHQIFSPFKITIEGDEDAISGNIWLSKRMVHINVDKKLGNSIIKKNLKKSEKGWYYESKF